MENENLQSLETSDTDDVVDYQENENIEENSFEESEENSFDEGEEKEEVTEPQDKGFKQSQEENAQFKKMRLKAEEEARRKLEAERSEIERMRRELQEEQAEKKIKQEYISQDKIYEKANEEGVSETIARKLLEAEAQTLIQSERVKVREQFEQTQLVKEKYRKMDSSFEKVNSKAEEYIRSNPNLNYDTAYLFAKGQVALEEQNTNQKEIEKTTTKRVIANVQDGMRRRTTPSGQAGDDSVDISNFSEKEKRLILSTGVDPREIARHLKNKKK